MDELSRVLVEKEPFAVTNYTEGNWAVTKAIEATAMIAAKEAQAAEWKKKIDDWLTKEKQEYIYTVQKMEELLRPFAEKEVEGKKTRTVSFPNGKAGFRKSPDKLEIEDEKATLAWAKEHKPEAVKVTESVLKTPLMEGFKATGELPDGVKFVEGVDTFYLKPLE
jgi:phage host-nuclease inhibitor protein Gam